MCKSMLLVAIGLAAPYSIADEKDKADKSLFVTLAAKNKVIKAGGTLTLSLTVENRGDKIMRFPDPLRSDSESAFYRLTVLQDGKEFEGLPMKLVGWPIMADKDYIKLKPGEKTELELSRFALLVRALPPGRYQAVLRFGAEPEKGDYKIHQSKPVDFTVEK